MQDDKKGWYIGSQSNQEDWVNELMFFVTTVLEENKQKIEVQHEDTDRVKCTCVKLQRIISDLEDKNVQYG